MTDAKDSEGLPNLRAGRLVDRDTIVVEFLIDDLVKQLLKDPISPVANCNGCSRCSAAVDLPVIRGGK